MNPTLMTILLFAAILLLAVSIVFNAKTFNSHTRQIKSLYTVVENITRGKHRNPHFAEDGGCLCKCPDCLQVRMRTYENGKVQIAEKCICGGCNENCPSERVTFVSVSPQ